MSTYLVRRRLGASRAFWIGTLLATLFAAGVGVLVLVNGVEAMPSWLITVALFIGGVVVSSAVGGVVSRELHGYSIRRVRRFLVAGDLRGASIELTWLVEENEKLVGPDDPLTLRWKLTLAHVLLRRGRIGAAMPMLETVVMTQLLELGPHHPDTVRSLQLMNRLTTSADPLSVPVEIWWR